MLNGGNGKRSRKRIGLIGAVVLAGVVAASFFGIQMATAGDSPPVSSKHAAPAPFKIDSKEQLISGSTLFTTGLFGALGAASFTPLDSAQSIKCAGKSCTALITATVQAFNGTGGNFAICPTVDGLAGDCPYVGPLNTGAYETYTWPETFGGLAKGYHTLQTIIYADAGASVGYYTVQYEMYADK